MENLTTKIAGVLKPLRLQKGWSLDRASQKTGVSKAMLGQIERGESSPTIATLWKIACGFDISFSSLVADFNAIEPLHRSENLQPLALPDNKIRVVPIFAYDPALKFEVFIIELLSGCEHLSLPHQAGVIEHIIVAEGNIEVCIGSVWHALRKNEGLNFKADQSHGYRNLNSEKAVFHNIIHYQKI